MNCYEWAKGGLETTAVAACPGCGVALCIAHIGRERVLPEPAGAQVGRSHDTWRAPVGTASGS
jgi:hypothetical protein